MKWIEKMNEELEITDNKQVQISEVNGRTQIIFKKAQLKGKVTSSEVLQTLLVAAKLQGEYYIKKLSRGSPLDSSEVKSLKDLADITKLEVNEVQKEQKQSESITIDSIKATLYTALTEKLKD